LSGILDQAIQAIMLGGLYAMFALGLAVSVGVLRFINVAHGDMIVLISFIFLSLTETVGLPLIIAIPMLLPIGALIGWVLQRGLFQKAADGNEMQIILVTFGLSVVIQNALQGIYGADTQKVTAGGIELQSIHVTDTLNIGVLPLMVFVTAIVMIFVLEQFLYRTRIGTMIRAIADDPSAARLVGLSSTKLFAVAMVVVGITVGIAGGYMAIWTNFDPTSGPSRLLIAFEVVVLAGLGSFWGVLAGGIIIAAAQTIGATYDSAFQVLGGHIVFLLIFLVRPQGLFPKS
jgi:branched-chain amino acid transport system permease protein